MVPRWLQDGPREALDRFLENHDAWVTALSECRDAVQRVLKICHRHKTQAQDLLDSLPVGEKQFWAHSFEVSDASGTIEDDSRRKLLEKLLRSKAQMEVFAEMRKNLRKERPERLIHQVQLSSL